MIVAIFSAWKSYADILLVLHSSDCLDVPGCRLHIWLARLRVDGVSYDDPGDDVVAAGQDVQFRWSRCS